jgi:hypothetical protein
LRIYDYLRGQLLNVGIEARLRTAQLPGCHPLEVKFIRALTGHPILSDPPLWLENKYICGKISQCKSEVSYTRKDKQ